jgi:diadenosine tetraphosphate (Ap4A) HIT family hydrolase
MADKKKFVNAQAAQKRAAYKELLERIEGDGVCPFCPDHFERHTKPILFNGSHWLVTENIAPYEGTHLHLLFLHKKHIEHPGKVTPAAWSELRSLIGKATRKFKMPGGALFMRFGDMRYTGASVAHLHAQLLMGTAESAKTDRIKVTLGHKKK